MNIERDWPLFCVCVLIGLYIRVLYMSGRKA